MTEKEETLNQRPQHRNKSFTQKAQFLSTGHAQANMPVSTLVCAHKFGTLETDTQFIQENKVAHSAYCHRAAIEKEEGNTRKFHQKLCLRQQLWSCQSNFTSKHYILLLFSSMTCTYDCCKALRK